MSETKGWYQDFEFATFNSWLSRGGFRDRNEDSGIFAIGSMAGDASSARSFRVVMLEL